MTESDILHLQNGLEKPWKHGEHHDATGAHFSQTVDLSGLTLRSFDASGTIFQKGFHASRATFAGMAWFRNATIKGICDLSGASFRNDLRLDGLQCDTLNLSACRIEGVLSLDGVTVGTLDLRDAVCLANLSLSQATVTQAVMLDRTEVMGGFWHAGASLTGLSAVDLAVDGRQPRFESVASGQSGL